MLTEAGPPPAYARYSAASERTIFSTDSSIIEPGISNVSRIRTSSSQYSTVSSVHDPGRHAHQNNATGSSRPTPLQPGPVPQTSFTHTPPFIPARAPPFRRSSSPTASVTRAADCTDNPKNPTFDSCKGKEPSANWFDRLITDWWWWELLSWIVSGMAMGAIVIVLVIYDGQPIPRWRFGITLNAYVAVLAAISRAALILPVSEAIGQLKWLRVRQSVPLIEFHDMDNASRGPWGSLMLMIRSRLSHVAAVGAAITVLSLAVEPFFQQIVDYPSRSIATDIGVIPFADQYNVRAGRLQPLDNDRIMQSAIDGAYYGSNNTVFGLRPVCPTSECSWADYSSLAVCSSCKDATAMLKYRCFKNEKVFFGRQSQTAGYTENGCAWFVNGTFAIGMYGDYVGQQSIRSLAMHPVARLDNITRFTGVSPAQHFSWLNATFYKDTPNLIIDFYASTVEGGPIGVLNNNTATLSNCVLQWCTQTYQSTYSAGIFQERVVSIFTNNTNEPNYIDLEKGHPSVIMAPPDKNWTYTAANESTKALKSRFLELFAEDIVVSEPKNISGASYEFSGLLNFGTVEPYNISSYLELIATAMTTTMRMHDGASQKAIGSAYSLETFVDVRWYWISLPVALLIASFVFLFIAIMKNNRRGATVWKNAALATLVYGLDESSKRMVHNAPMSQVEAIAEATAVRLTTSASSTWMKIEVPQM